MIDENNVLCLRPIDLQPQPPPCCPVLLHDGKMGDICYKKQTGFQVEMQQ